ncbi:MAG TPA: DUF882 domain-containing protein [Steroidobacteraceae bacterium]|nr:DUF882 domain-containing protein [Steroidobacteraceae bacterium]
MAASTGPGVCDLGRRQFLVHAARVLPLAALAPLPLRAVASAIPAREQARSLTLLNTHTGESLCAAYRDGEQFNAENLARFNFLLRDYRTGAVKTIDPPLFDILHDVAWKLGVDPHFEVISGYRSPETNALLHERSSGVASHSLHMDGKAIDVRLVGVNTRHLFDAGLTLGRGGCGYYGKSDFAHLDTGRVRSWRG